MNSGCSSDEEVPSSLSESSLRGGDEGDGSTLSPDTAFSDLMSETDLLSGDPDGDDCCWFIGPELPSGCAAALLMNLTGCFFLSMREGWIAAPASAPLGPPSGF